MKNLILVSIISLALLSSCSTLEITTAGQSYHYPGSSELNEYFDHSLEEDYWLMSNDNYFSQFRDPFRFLNQHQRNYSQKYLIDDN